MIMMRKLVVFFLVLQLVIGTGVSAEAQEKSSKMAVLKVEAYQVFEDTVALELSSGNSIEISREDFSKKYTKGVNQAIESQKKKEEAKSSAVPPTRSEAEPLIRSHCSDKWSDNYRMQKHCMDQQFESLRTLRNRSMNSEALSSIRSRCARKWSDNYRMRNHCEEQQIESLRELNR
jgi:phenylalanyl-tRNA synthetase alpha subunit